jgi:hypothetical protein
MTFRKRAYVIFAGLMTLLGAVLMATDTYVARGERETLLVQHARLTTQSRRLR